MVIEREISCNVLAILLGFKVKPPKLSCPFSYIDAHKHFFHLEMERISSKHAGNNRKLKRAKNKQ